MRNRPPPPPRKGLKTTERLRRMRKRYEYEEKPFDPARPMPRETRPYHFAVNASEELFFLTERGGERQGPMTRFAAEALAREIAEQASRQGRNTYLSVTRGERWRGPEDSILSIDVYQGRITVYDQDILDLLIPAVVRGGYGYYTTATEGLRKQIPGLAQEQIARMQANERALRRNHGNVTVLYANPYAGGPGFYMRSSEEWTQGYQAGLRRGIEEYEIDFIDGPSYLASLFNALEIDQGTVELWFDELEHLSQDQAVTLYALAQYRGGSLPREELERLASDGADVVIYQGSAREVAAQMLDDMDEDSLVAQANVYFDWQAYGNYMENSIGTAGDAESYEAWQDLVDEADGDLGEAAYRAAKESHGTDAHGGVNESFYREALIEWGAELRDFMDVDQFAHDLTVEGDELDFGGQSYMFFPE